MDDDEKGPWNSGTDDEEQGPWSAGAKTATATAPTSSSDLDEYLKHPPPQQEGTAEPPPESFGEWYGRKQKEEAGKSTWQRIGHALNPLADVGAVSEGLGAVSESLRRKSEEQQQKDLAATAAGQDVNKPVAQPQNFMERLTNAVEPYRRPAALTDLAARTTKMAAGLTSPESIGQIGAAVAAPEVMLPYFFYQGAKMVWDPAKKVYEGIDEGKHLHEILSPEEAEQLLMGTSMMAGAAGGAGEGIKRAGGIKNAIIDSTTGRLTDWAARGTPLTDAGRVEKAISQILEVKQPGMSEIDYAKRVRDSVQDLQDIAARNQGKIKTPRDARNAIHQRIGEIENPIGEHLKGVDFDVHPDQLLNPVSDAIDKALNRNAGTLSTEEKAAAKKRVMDWLGERPRSVEEIEGNRRRLNDDADKYYKSDTAGKQSIDVSDGTAIAQRAAADAIRNVLYGDGTNPGMLERAGVSATDANGNPISLRDVRKRVGNLLDIRDHFEDAITKAERQGDWSAFGSLQKGPSLAAGGLGALVGLMKGYPVMGIMTGEAAKALGDYRAGKNVNVKNARAWESLARTAPKTPLPPINVATRPAIHDYERPVGPLQHEAAVGPFPAEPPFEIPGANQPNRTGLWQQQVGEPPALETGAPTPGRHIEPIGPREAPEAPLAPIRGEQQDLGLPPKEAELFNLQQTPRVPREPAENVPRGTSVPEIPPRGTKPAREAAIGPVGKGVELGKGEDLGPGLGTEHEITRDGKRIGSVTVEPRPDGTLHVHWLGGDLGADVIRGPLRDELMKEYPDTTKVTYDRRRLAKGATAATTEPREMKLGAIGEKEAEHAPTGSIWEGLSNEVKDAFAKEKIGPVKQTGMEDLKTGDTFVDDTGEPRRIMEITDDGKIHTADGSERTYEGDVEHLGEINSARAQLARGGKFIGTFPEEETAPPPAAKTEEAPAAAEKTEEPKKFTENDVRVSPRSPSGANATENGHTTPLQIDLDSVLKAPPDNQGVTLAQRLHDTIKDYPGMKRILQGAKDAPAALNAFIDHIADNLEWLHNQMPEEVRNYTKQWYDSAHNYTKEAAEKYGYDHQQSAGVMASQSPQKDWDMNVSLHDRILDTYKNQQNTKTTPEMLKTMQRLDRIETVNKVNTVLKRLARNEIDISEKAAAQAKELAKKGFRQAAFDLINKKADLDAPLKTPNSQWKQLAKNVEGKTLGELPVKQQAAWVRAFDEAHNPRTYTKYAPDGTSMGLSLKKNGKPAKVAWGTNPSIEKAINMLRDGSRENISRNLGDEHKVRSFYNNIIDPNGQHGDVTIDTHAVAAGQISPHSGKSLEVENNFGGPGSNTTGSNGTYPLYAEAYRRAAQRVNLLPRQLQSIVWEQIRDLYPDTFKTKANQENIKGIWRDFGDEKISLDEARKKVVDAAGGFQSPEWLKHVQGEK